MAYTLAHPRNNFCKLIKGEKYFRKNMFALTKILKHQIDAFPIYPGKYIVVQLITDILNFWTEYIWTA